MGVPALFRWLSSKYPKIVERVQEAPKKDFEGVEIPINLTDPNPNGSEFDNLYLDMNGIIHPCCHPMDKPTPETEEDMMVEIFKYIDRIFAMIRPRKMLFMAIDGVAPRAKMNQQRSRRFRAAKERKEKAEKEAILREELQGEDDEEEQEVAVNGGSNFDSNCITPGTKFMSLVATSIRYYVVDRMQKDEAWKGIKVIFTDASVPGEGEHKIMDYIRRQRLDPDYDPNTKHVIYGLDADLIMLSMATHEPYFRVLREDVFWEEQVKYNPCTYCGQKGHSPDACRKRAKEDPSFIIRDGDEKPFIFLDVAILREYLEVELKPSGQLPYKWDLERAIDDWIFMCFFVGNDFLPHLPSLEIREGAIDMLMEIYKANIVKMGGFICHHGSVDLKRVQHIVTDLGKLEHRIFQQRREKEERKMENIKRRKKADMERDEMTAAQQSLISGSASIKLSPVKPGEVAEEGEENKSIIIGRRQKNYEAAQALKQQLSKDDDSEPADDVRLWERGFKDRYYRSKFHVDADDFDYINKVCRDYVEGLCWVMAYYYQGCPSWKWFYPHHFAPMASDMNNVGDFDIVFELGEPFRPFDQLMGVFPADSRTLVPQPFHRLMTESDSEVIDFYPEDFAIDLNGKKQVWQGVALLPFIDEGRLLTALDKVYPELETNDLLMNLRGQDRVFYSATHPIVDIVAKELDDTIHSVPLNPQESGGLAGYVKIDPEFSPLHGVFPSPLVEKGCPDIKDLQVCSYIYYYPYHERRGLRHKSLLLPDACRPPAVLSDEDIAPIQSGAAGRRVPGRLLIDVPGSGRGGNGGNGMSYGYHSMHQEHARDYQERDSGRRYQGGNYQGGGHQQHQGGHYNQRPYGDASQRRYPPPPPSMAQYPAPMQGHYMPPPMPQIPMPQMPRPGHPTSNPFDILRSNSPENSSPPPPGFPMQPAMGLFHRGPPPNNGNSNGIGRKRNGDQMDSLYGRYPPPSKH